MTQTKQPTVREINAHLMSGSSYCYVSFTDGRCMRIARARTQQGIRQGRVINAAFWPGGNCNTWETIPADAHIELM